MRFLRLIEIIFTLYLFSLALMFLKADSLSVRYDIIGKACVVLGMSSCTEQQFRIFAEFFVEERKDIIFPLCKKYTGTKEQLEVVALIILLNGEYIVNYFLSIRNIEKMKIPQQFKATRAPCVFARSSFD